MLRHSFLCYVPVRVVREEETCSSTPPSFLVHDLPDLMASRSAIENNKGKNDRNEYTPVHIFPIMEGSFVWRLRLPSWPLATGSISEGCIKYFQPVSAVTPAPLRTPPSPHPVRACQYTVFLKAHLVNLPGLTYRSWGHSIHAYALWSKLLCQGSRKRHNSSFG